MARQILLLALVLFAVVGLASVAVSASPVAAATPPVAKPAVATSPAAGGDDDDVGTLDGNEDAAPVGGPVPEGVFATNAPAPSPKGGAAALEVSAVGGVAAAAVAAFFL